MNTDVTCYRQENTRAHGSFIPFMLQFNTASPQNQLSGDFFPNLWGLTSETALLSSETPFAGYHVWRAGTGVWPRCDYVMTKPAIYASWYGTDTTCLVTVDSICMCPSGIGWLESGVREADKDHRRSIRVPIRTVLALVRTSTCRSRCYPWFVRAPVDPGLSNHVSRCADDQTFSYRTHGKKAQILKFKDKLMTEVGNDTKSTSQVKLTLPIQLCGMVSPAHQSSRGGKFPNGDCSFMVKGCRDAGARRPGNSAMATAWASNKRRQLTRICAVWRGFTKFLAVP
ncbi:hypothetical protein Bbelb_355450 [Branchiostoma belcheri]|nr:hypothetical protein Bbelb_355450 [Branchiostoma belcheri]